MTIREKIVSKVQTLPEGVLGEVYDFVTDLEGRQPASVMERLRRVHIEGPTDFAQNIDHYLNRSGSATDDPN